MGCFNQHLGTHRLAIVDSPTTKQVSTAKGITTAGPITLSHEETQPKLDKALKNARSYKKKTLECKLPRGHNTSHLKPNFGLGAIKVKPYLSFQIQVNCLGFKSCDSTLIQKCTKDPVLFKDRSIHVLRNFSWSVDMSPKPDLDLYQICQVS
ncbi:hypothetical protein VNO77_03649 [Canavalia gladiata]|uniref:Uncharacterized protein n=1 Tax=Canavalia gladiata TaxID=3824 RepID=A0AAN9R8C0_CANGL